MGPKCFVTIKSSVFLPLYDRPRSRSALSHIKTEMRRHCVSEDSDAVVHNPRIQSSQSMRLVLSAICQPPNLR